MNEMVERAIRAMWDKHLLDTHMFGGPHQDDTFDELPDCNKEALAALLRAAIAAMREPTLAMLEVAVCSPADAIPRWQAMIDAALK